MKSIVLVAVAGVVLAACGGGGDEADEEQSLATWAAGFCEVAEYARTALTDASPGDDPTRLSLEDRKARSAKMTGSYREIFGAARDRLDDLHPPAMVRGYHEAVVTQMSRLEAAMKDAETRIQSATTMQEIEAENARLAIVQAETAKRANAEGEALPPDAKAALAGITHCGNALR